jgi:hypothetical protein
MNQPSPPLPRVKFTRTFIAAPYLFLAIVPEYDNTSVRPNGCGSIQTDRTTASTMYINSGVFPGNLFEAELYSFPLSGFPVALAVNPPNTPAPTLMI